MAEGDVYAAANDSQGRQGADDNGIGKDLKNAVQALLDWTLGISRRVGNGCRTEAGFVGECASAQTPDDRLLERNATSCAAERLGCKRCGKNLAESRANIAGMAENHDQREDDVQNAHNWDKFFRHGADALDAAEKDYTDQRGNHNAEHEVQQLPLLFRCRDKGVDGVVQGANDGVDLRHVADAEGGDGRKDAEQNADPLPMLAEAVFDVVHRAADPVTLRVALTVLDRQCNLGIFDHHTEQRRQPQPEHCAVAAERDGLRGADNIAGADRRGQCRCDGLQGRDRACACLLLLEHLSDRVFHRIAEARELNPAIANGQIQTADDGTWQKDIQPCDRIQAPRKEIDDSFHSSPFRTSRGRPSPFSEYKSMEHTIP